MGKAGYLWLSLMSLRRESVVRIVSPVRMVSARVMPAVAAVTVPVM